MTRHDADLDLLVAGALLDDLDPTELDRYEAHQPGCQRCAVLTADLGRTLGDLALVAQARRPPASLGRSIGAAIAAERATNLAPGPVDVVTEPAIAGAPSPVDVARKRDPWLIRLGWRRGASGLRLAPVLAAALVGVAVVGAWGLSLRTDLDRATVEAARTRETLALQSQAMAVAMSTGHRTATLDPEALAPVAGAVVVYEPGRTHAYLLARDLPATPAGSVYRLWMADDAGVHGLGTYAFDGDGLFVADFGRDLAGASAVMVTLEPVGGAAAEPGPQVVFGQL